MEAKKRNLLKTAALGALISLAACAPKNNNETEMSSIDSSSESIIGGEAVAPGDSLVKSTVGVATKGDGLICTGTLIAKNLVVTAGHCTMDLASPQDLYIIFGNDLNSKTVQKRNVLGGRVPAKWPLLGRNQNKDWGDIALLRIDGEAPAGFQAAVVLANKAALKDGLDVTIAGYGLVNVATQTLPNLLQKAVIKLTQANYSDSEILFAQFQGKGACHGDSGGPAFIDMKGRKVLIGVTSRSATAKGGMNCQEGSIYTSVAAHIAFLKQAAKELTAKTFVPGEAIPSPAN
jgi:secreted trypsin-like serine protease